MTLTIEYWSMVMNGLIFNMDHEIYMVVASIDLGQDQRSKSQGIPGYLHITF